MFWLASHLTEITLYALAVVIFATVIAYDWRTR